MKKKLFALLSLVVMLVVIIFGWLWITKKEIKTYKTDMVVGNKIETFDITIFSNIHGVKTCQFFGGKWTLVAEGDSEGNPVCRVLNK